MFKRTYLFLFLLLSYFSGNGQTVGTGQLKIGILNQINGITLNSIQSDQTELLKNSGEIFTLFLKNTDNNNTPQIVSSANWGNVDVNLTNGNKDCTITLSNPNIADIPATLVATITIQTNDTTSQWDLQVSGLGDHASLMDVHFPHINIKGDGGHFMVPKYSGKLFANPAQGIQYDALYPNGWNSTMQFMTYYGDGPDIYLGFHDSSASMKTFHVQNENDGVTVEAHLPAPNKSLTNNDWEYPGKFAFNLYEGDWWDAAIIYKDWVAGNGSYWPQDSPQRHDRQANMAKVDAWFTVHGYYDGAARTIQSIKDEVQAVIDYFPNANVGIHYYSWYGQPFDDNYPEIFPAIDGTEGLIEDIQNQGALVMPYINGYLYDSGLPDFNTNGLPYATKNIDGDYFFQNYYNSNGDLINFAIMCPTQTTWQNTNKDACVQITNNLGAAGVYIDQVCAASSKECMDTNHGHTLGGGNYWREGYKQMLSSAHDNMPDGKFITVEGGTDYQIDQVDGFLVGGWESANLVPAFQAVYSGKVQFFGSTINVSTYNNHSYFTKLAQAFVFGTQPGRFFGWMVQDPNAADIVAPYARRLASLRNKISPFLSFGEMQYPPTVDAVTPIPDITSTWKDYGADVDVTISALQKSIWKHGDSVMIVFVNASMDNELQFNYTFTGEPYGLSGTLKAKDMTDTEDGNFEDEDNSFTRNITMPAMSVKAIVIKAANPLPITLMAFSGQKRNKTVVLNWETTSEVNFEGFEIERSADGLQWNSIGFVPAHQETLAQNSYQIIDTKPLEGDNYYRLKEKDLDGSFKYSEIVHVFFRGKDISIRPNPATDEIFIDIDGYTIDKILIYNQLGQNVYSSNTPTNTLQVGFLPKGIYTLFVQSKQDVSQEVLIIE